ncbi:MAG: hypothetical protein HKN20_08690 [Gemmatimonadetes bacterium]|nr:hypothetical protein [Gemmatimonadota bacterium]
MMPAQFGHRFRAMTLAAPDPGALAVFYSETLGLPVRVEGEIAIVSAGSNELRFERGAGAPFYHFAFNIRPLRLEDARAWLAERVTLLRYAETGEEVVAFPSWNAHSVYFHDPAGNIVEFIARHDLKVGQAPNDPADSPFGAADILGLSEIALVVDDVRETVRAIREAFGLAVYGGDEGDEVFTAMGDERGLVLAIRNDWPWLPEKTRLAEAHPVRLEIESSATAPPGTVWRFACYEIRA